MTSAQVGRARLEDRETLASAQGVGGGGTWGAEPAPDSIRFASGDWVSEGSICSGSDLSA